jgi:hypothetical protein
MSSKHQGTEQGQALIRRAIRIGIASTTPMCGETTGNNRGPALSFYRRRDGTGKPDRPGANWCGAYASFLLILAAKRNREMLGFPTSRGAKRLVRNMGRRGALIKEPFKGGCGLIAWHSRLGRLSWKGHVGIWTDYDPITDTLYTLEGNRRHPGHKLTWPDTFTYPNGRWRRRFALMAVL